MARLQGLAALIVLVIFLGGIGTAPKFKVQISDVTGSNNVTFSYSEVADPVHRINSTVENTGSIGCEYRLRAEFTLENMTEERWSDGYALWPGDAKLLEIEYIPYNYTGAVDSEVELHYCGQEKTLKKYSFNVTERVSSSETVETRTLSSNSSSATVSTDVKEGKMVPHRVPAGWKASTVEISDGEAQVKYSPYLFQSERELTYLVTDLKGDIVGTATVELEARPRLMSRLKNMKLEILLLVSAALNIVLVTRQTGIGSKALKPLK